VRSTSRSSASGQKRGWSRKMVSVLDLNFTCDRCGRSTAVRIDKVWGAGGCGMLMKTYHYLPEGWEERGRPEGRACPQVNHSCSKCDPYYEHVCGECRKK